MQKHIRQSAAEVILRLNEAGIVIPDALKQVARIAGAGSEIDGPKKDPEDLLDDGRQHLWLTPDQAKRARERKDDPQEKAECYLDRIPKAWKDKWRDRLISKDDWAPEKVDEHTEQFYHFIESHIPCFDKIIADEGFYLYIEQQQRWLDEGTTVADFEGQSQWEFVQTEFERMSENTLYGMNKYGWIKDDSVPARRRDYKASTPQALICYLLDCGYSLEMGKGRQAAITSTVMLYEAIRMLVQTSYKGVLVTDDIEFTGKAIFNEKLKASLMYMRMDNAWIYPPGVGNWADKNIVFDWSEGKAKHEKKVISSQYSLAASDDTQTINGTTPSKVVFDEAQNIPTYQEIKREARPTMLAAGLDGTIRIARQIVAFGTGSSHQRGKGAFENEYKSTISKWNRRETTSSFVPLFLDWTCRPYMTRKRYLIERAYYIDNDENEETKGMSKEERTSMFHAAMPSSPDDMFLTSHKTMVPSLLIKKQQDRILKMNTLGGGAIRGRFVPVFNHAVSTTPGFYIPNPVIGSKWQEADPDDIDAPVKMLMPPERFWVYRYYQGTDPIQSASGTSKFASVIWDNVGPIKVKDGQQIFHPMPVCILNDRQSRVEESYLQSKLMGMYYANHGQKACMELTERNQGQDYESFVKTQMDLRESLWLRGALPKDYRGGSHEYGVDLKQGRKGFALYYDTSRMLMDFHENIWFNEIWAQVRNIDVEERPDGSMDWGTVNKNAFNDDLVIACSYAHISCRAENKDPKKINSDVPEYRTVKKLVRGPRQWNGQPGQLVYADVKELVKY